MRDLPLLMALLLLAMAFTITMAADVDDAPVGWADTGVPIQYVQERYDD